MTDQISNTLSWIANYSNFYSVISVVICFCVMVVFILSLNGDHLLMSSSSTHYNVVKEQPMVYLHNPFSVQLNTNKSSSLNDGVHLDVIVTRGSKVSVLWALDIQAFQKELQLSATLIASRYRDGKLFDNKYQRIIDCGIISPSDAATEVFAKCPDDVTEETLGEPPRQVYPAVVVSILEDSHVSSDYTEMVLQFMVLHIKDSVCPLDSHIVYQFVKTNHNRLFSLQPIFVSSNDPDTPKEMPSATTKSSQGSAADDPFHGENDCNKNMCDNCLKIKRSETICRSSENISFCICEGVECTESNNQNSSGINITQNNAGNGDENGTSTSIIENGDLSDIGLNECNMCIVCQNAVIFYTLLPCRHACVCSSCIKLLDRCPMCRGYIDSYFRLHNNAGQPLTYESEDLGSQGPRLSRWQAFNQRLNEMLGFT